MSPYNWMTTLMTSSVIRRSHSTWKIALPESKVVATVRWFHQVMGHPGEKRLQEMLNQHYNHPRLRYHIDKLKCKNCQKHKLAGRGYGLPTQTRGADCTLGRSCHQFDWTLEGQNQWLTS